VIPTSGGGLQRPAGVGHRCQQQLWSIGSLGGDDRQPPPGLAVRRVDLHVEAEHVRVEEAEGLLLVVHVELGDADAHVGHSAALGQRGLEWACSVTSSIGQAGSRRAWPGLPAWGRMAVEVEYDLLREFLDHERHAVVSSLASVPVRLLREPLVLPDASMLGLVKHLTHLERWWFTYTFAGIDACVPRKKDWHVDRRDTPAGIVRRYRAECARSRAIVERSSPDQLSVRPSPDGRLVSLRWILLHMIRETGRHVGHADVLRSLIDGATGPPPCVSPRPMIR
jgi:Protein of unknown function (DUF664)